MNDILNILYLIEEHLTTIEILLLVIAIINVIKIIPFFSHILKKENNKNENN